jgi:Transposase DDE domain
MVEAQLQLHGWSKKRRVVIVRQRIRGGIARERRVDGKQLRLDLAGPSVHEGDRLWEYAVLVTDVAYPLESIGQLYRDRADAENAFDELKNQWGLGGFTTQDINRCQTVARACALVYNWWSVRPAKAGVFSRSDPAGVTVRSPVAWIAGRRETDDLKPIDKPSLREGASHRAVTQVNAYVASKSCSSEG